MSKKILMALQGLEIGGAETHVVELSKELARKGYEVLVVSNGGVYERELTDSGIRCFHAPLHKRNARMMLRSLLILRDIIKTERPDVVHAHARIPAFLCGILHGWMHFPFVTSAHWVFYVNRSLKRLTNWGERTVAVSEDIREYLKREYGVPDENILVTINGIDTEKFSPTVSGERVMTEFGLSPQRPTISYVSRMDESRALVARHLVEIAPRLCERIPNLQILIAGGGDVFDEIYARAQEQNRAIGSQCIVMTGARTDINEIVAAGDMFIGVSRAALEAMAAEKSVIVAGNEGYIGLFGEDKLALAQESNFCCRGCAEPTPEKLYADIIHAMCDLDAQQRAALGRYGREVIGRYYSVRRMAQDCENAYKQVWNMRRRVVVSGYYGYRNLGDDAILLSIKEQLTRTVPGTTMVVLSRHPRETREKYGVEAVHRFAPLSVLRELKRASCLISGGGSLLQDNTSTRSLLYYTAIVRMARHYGKKIMFFANGIGPVHSAQNRERVREAAEMADVITLRDEISAQELASMGVCADKLTVTTDPVYCMTAISAQEAQERLRVAGISLDRPLVGISVRFAKGMETNIKEFAAFCDMVAERASVVFLVMQEPSDRTASEAVCAEMKHKAYLLSAPYDPHGMMGMIGCMDAVVATRLHSIIFSAHMGVPVLGVVYDPKVAGCLQQLEMPAAGTLEHFDAQQAYEKLTELLEHRTEHAERLERTVSALAQRAAENEARLEELLKSI